MSGLITVRAAKLKRGDTLALYNTTNPQPQRHRVKGISRSSDIMTITVSGTKLPVRIHENAPVQIFV